MKHLRRQGPLLFPSSVPVVPEAAAVLASLARRVMPHILARAAANRKERAAEIRLDQSWRAKHINQQ